MLITKSQYTQTLKRKQLILLEICVSKYVFHLHIYICCACRDYMWEIRKSCLILSILILTTDLGNSRELKFSS